jgi:predicted RNA-binding Zn-ribbon protein involved in translation (DUF1610 family)
LIAAYEPLEAERKEICDICGTEMFEVHCRFFCPGCGYVRDCSDP